MSENSVGITRLGCGIVGGGVVQILREQRDLLRKRTGINFDLRHVVDHDVPDPRAPGKLARLRPQDPEAKAVPVPMRQIDGQVFPRRLGRTNATEKMRHIRIKVQRDEVGEVAFLEPLGGQPAGTEALDDNRSVGRDDAGRPRTPDTWMRSRPAAPRRIPRKSAVTSGER